MNVIGHQAVAEQGKTAKFRRLPQQLEVSEAILVVCQNHLAGVAALRNVMGDARDDDAGQASH
jgi:hypothetical protein